MDILDLITWIGPRIGGNRHALGRPNARFYEGIGHNRPPGIREARVFTAGRGSRVPKVQCFRVPPKPANSKSTCFCLLLGPPVLRMPCFLGPFRLPQCPNSRDMAPNPRDMAPGSSGGAFEPAAGRTGGQGPRCPNPRDMAPNPRDMAPGSSGRDFEPAAAEGRRPGFCQKQPKSVWISLISLLKLGPG